LGKVKVVGVYFLSEGDKILIEEES